MLGVDHICIIGCNGCYYVGLGFTPHFTLHDWAIYFIDSYCLGSLFDGDFKPCISAVLLFSSNVSLVSYGMQYCLCYGYFIYIGLFIAYLSGAIVPTSS